MPPNFTPPHATEPGCGNDGETTVGVRQSRLGVRGIAPTPVGMVFLRNPQVRYTPLRNETWSASLGLESPAAAVDSGKVGQIEVVSSLGGFSSWNRAPDFTGQVRAQGDWGHVQLAGIVRRVGFEITTLDGDGPDGHEWGGGANLSGIFNVFGEDEVLWQVAGGKGFANYMNDGGTDLAPDSAGASPEATTVPLLGWLLYYNRQWNERWTSSIGFSEHRQFTTSGQTDDAFQVGQYGNVNLLFHPTPQMFVGPEFIWGRRKNDDGRDGSDSRVQVSFHYDFAATIFGGAR